MIYRMRITLFFTLAVSFVVGADLPSAAPDRAGFSPERLNRINTVMREHVAAGRLNGASGLIARNGKVVFRETWGDYKLDTIVRMYSMTKAITGVAAMMLYEEGRFSLNDPVSKYLPEFKDMRVGKESTDASGKKIYFSVPAERMMTVRDLFRHTTGMDYAGPKDEKGDPAYKKIEMLGGAPDVSFNLAEAAKRLATVPLNDEPGTKFRYGYSIDVLGRLVEVISGKPLDQFFQERIYGPLGMKDSGFFVPESKWSRLAVLQTPKREGGIEPSKGYAQEHYKVKPVADARRSRIRRHPRRLRSLCLHAGERRPARRHALSGPQDGGVNARRSFRPTAAHRRSSRRLRLWADLRH